MARSYRTSVNINGFNRKTEDAYQAVSDGARQGMLYTIRAGLREGRKLIELRGTQGSKARFAGEYLPVTGPGNSPGRNNTGLMSDSLTAEVTELTGYKVVGEVGWLDEFEKYFEWQEEGFWNWKAWDWRSESFRGRREPTWTEGMFIFKDIKTIMSKIAKGQVSQQVDAKLKEIQ